MLVALQLVQVDMLSKLNPLHYWPRSKKAKGKATASNPSFPKMWRRSQTMSSNSVGLSPKLPSVVTRSQVKRSATMPSSRAMAPRRKLSQALPQLDRSRHSDEHRDTLSPDYFMDVNLRLTNTSATSITTEVTVEPVH